MLCPSYSKTAHAGIDHVAFGLAPTTWAILPRDSAYIASRAVLGDIVAYSIHENGYNLVLQAWLGHLREQHSRARTPTPLSISSSI